MRLENAVFACRLVHILELVRKTGTAGGAHAEAQTHALAAPVDIAGDVPRCFFSQSDCHSPSIR